MYTLRHTHARAQFGVEYLVQGRWTGGAAAAPWWKLRKQLLSSNVQPGAVADSRCHITKSHFHQHTGQTDSETDGLK